MQNNKNLTAKEKAEFIRRLTEKGISLEEALELLEKGRTKVVDYHEETTKEDLTFTISKIIKEIGVPAHLWGYEAIRKSIEYVIKHGRCYMTKELYPNIAKEMNTTPSKVERSIRHAIEVAFDRADIDVIYKYFGCSINLMNGGKATNEEFIYTIVDYLKQHNP